MANNIHQIRYYITSKDRKSTLHKLWSQCAQGR